MSFIFDEKSNNINEVYVYFKYWLRQILEKSKIPYLYSRYGVFKQNISKARYILFTYFIITMLGSIFLYQGFSQNPNAKISFFESVFTAASAFSDTGLVLKPTYSSWNMVGQAIIAILILVGGLGYFTLKMFFISWIFKLNSNINQRELVSIERGAKEVGKTTRVIVVSIFTMFVFMIISSIILTLYFYYVAPSSTYSRKSYTFDSPIRDWKKSIRYGIFHSITALNNAGFDIISDKSILPYNQNYSLQIIFIILFIVGGIGYPTVYDIVQNLYIKLFRKNEPIIWSLFTKVSVLFYFLVTIFSIALVFIFETTSKSASSIWNNKENGSNFDKSMAIIFNTLSTRSAGFSSVDLYNLTPGSLLIFSIAMFIGASPSSTGGGIRTTTFAIILLGIAAKLSNKPSLRMFKRKIESSTVLMSYLVFTLSMTIVLANTFILLTSHRLFDGTQEREYDLSHIIFEVTSSFGTTGLSTGLTHLLNTFSLVSLSLLMFIGQLGISSTILSWKNKRKKPWLYDYVETDISIG